MTQAIRFCMRINLNSSPAIEQFVDSGELERIIDLRPGSQARAEGRRRGVSLEPVRMRLVRVELKTGEVEVLITSLLATVACPHQQFADLYHQRWGIEEGYKALKCRAEGEGT